jgi:hypothetical protein
MKEFRFRSKLLKLETDPDLQIVRTIDSKRQKSSMLSNWLPDPRGISSPAPNCRALQSSADGGGAGGVGGGAIFLRSELLGYCGFVISSNSLQLPPRAQPWREGGDGSAEGRRSLGKESGWVVLLVLSGCFGACVLRGDRFLSSGTSGNVPAFQAHFLRFLPLDSIPAKFSCASHVLDGA